MQEIWKDINFIDNGIKYDYTSLYQISNYGRIKSLRRITHNNHIIEEKILKTRIDKDGYEIATLYKVWEKRKDFKVHRLVAFMFLENKNPKKLNIVNHKDGNRANNLVTNLNWFTTKENNNYGGANLKLSIPVEQYDINGNFIRYWNSANEVKKVLGYDNSSITKCCKGKLKTSHNYIWKYAKTFKK